MPRIVAGYCLPTFGLSCLPAERSTLGNVVWFATSPYNALFHPQPTSTQQDRRIDVKSRLTMGRSYISRILRLHSRCAICSASGWQHLHPWCECDHLIFTTLSTWENAPALKYGWICSVTYHCTRSCSKVATIPYATWPLVFHGATRHHRSHSTAFSIKFNNLPLMTSPIL